MASATTDLLIGKIVGLFENEASSIAGVSDQVDEIKQELLYMNSFLQDAEGKEPHTEGEKAWFTMVRNVAFKAEVIIDKFMYDMYEQKSRGRFARWLQKFTFQRFFGIGVKSPLSYKKSQERSKPFQRGIKDMVLVP